MSFLHPLILWLLLLPAALAGGALILHMRTRQNWRQLVSPRHPELIQQNPLWRTRLPLILTLAALALGILALARPINGYTESTAFTSGRNLIIALDISRSMETQDVSPSRLEEARAAAYELIDALPGDKIGLIVFAGEADLIVPLTYDHTALRDALEQVNRDWTGYGGTNFGLVLNRAMSDFERSAPQGTNALVILSDGEDTVETSLDLAEAARNKRMLVITVGIGTAAGAPIPDPRGENGLWQDAAGKHVISKLDENRLQRFAEATGGSYFTMGSGADLAAFAQEAVAQLDRHEEAFSSNKVPRDLYAWFAGAALLLLLLAILLGTQWRQPGRLLSLLILLLVIAPTYAAEQQYAEAYSTALQHASNQESQAAKEQLSQALLDDDTRLQSASLFALGNLNTEATLQHLRQLYGEATVTSDENAAPPAQPTPEQLQGIVDSLKRDITSYRDALSITPHFPACQTNQQRIQQLIQTLEEEIERMKQQQNQQDKSDQQQNQDPQDKSDQQQNQDQQDKSDQQQNQDQQDKPDQQQNQDQQDKSNQQQNQDQQGKSDQQQNQDQQDKPDQQQNQDQQDKPDQQQNQDQQDKSDQQQNQDQQGKSDQQQNQDPQGKSDQQQNQDQQDKSDQQQSSSTLHPLSDTDKAKQRAASILQMHVDEEKGSPIPHFNNHMRPPSKDY